MRKQMKHYEDVVKSIKQGCLYSAIKREAKHLQKHGYGEKESNHRAWSNRKYLFRQMLKANKNELQEMFFESDNTEQTADNTANMTGNIRNDDVFYEHPPI